MTSSEIEVCLLRQFEVDTVAVVKPYSFYAAVHFLTEFDKHGGPADTRAADGWIFPVARPLHALEQACRLG